MMDIQNKNNANLHILILCGGKSSRMGTDKYLLDYHGKAQCYYLYDLFAPFCESVFISCNDSQAGTISPAYSIIVDLPAYTNCGPMAALLTAFDLYPGKNILVTGCDYPFLTAADISTFLQFIQPSKSVAAFYNKDAGLYEPLLAYYSHDCAPLLQEMHLAANHSLQSFLKEANAAKFYPANPNTIKSIDTKEKSLEIKQLIKNNVESNG